MALRITNVFRPLRLITRFSSATSYSTDVDQTSDTSQKTNMPVKMLNPYSREKQKCILCKYRITPNYKNVRLLSQFVSRFTGKIYTRNITGLCEKQQLAVQSAIRRAIKCGLMAGYYREPKYAHDPKLFNPDNPFRPHRY